MDAVKQTTDYLAKCPHCGYGGPHALKPRSSGIHYADVNCGKCHGHWFPSKPDSDPTKYKRPQQHRELVAAYGKDFCEMCLRSVNELPKSQTLVAHHVIEYQDGGTNKRENIWVICTACHQMIHWIRTYHGTIVLRNQATDMVLFTK